MRITNVSLLVSTDDPLESEWPILSFHDTAINY
jgi:hypothetical protein